MFEHMLRVVHHKDEKGASAVEYGLLVAAIAALIVVVVFLLGGLIRGAFTKTCSAINSNGVNSNTTTCS